MKYSVSVIMYLLRNVKPPSKKAFRCNFQFIGNRETNKIIPVAVNQINKK